MTACSAVMRLSLCTKHACCEKCLVVLYTSVPCNHYRLDHCDCAHARSWNLVENTELKAVTVLMNSAVHGFSSALLSLLPIPLLT